MLFKLKRNDLIQDLQLMVSIIEKKQTIPILSDVLIKFENDSIVMTGTDLELQLSTTIDAEVIRQGEVTFSARKFFDICRNLPDNSVISIDIQDGSAELRSGRSRFRLATRNAQDFPVFSIDTYNVSIEIDSNNLRKVLQTTYFCMATHDVRYYLNGLLIEISSSQIGSVASNGHRLAIYKQKLEQDNNVNAQFIIPRKGVMELLRLLERDTEKKIQLQVSDSNMEINIDDKVFLTKLIDGKFPDFKGALSQPIGHHFILNNMELKGALTRVSVLSNEKFQKITLRFFNNILLICTDNSEQEQADEELDIDYQGESYEVSLNISYLLEVINNISHKTIELSFTEDTNICLISNSADLNQNYVIMPLI